VTDESETEAPENWEEGAPRYTALTACVKLFAGNPSVSDDRFFYFARAMEEYLRTGVVPLSAKAIFEGRFL
jgi:hypothetical protein